MWDAVGERRLMGQSAERERWNWEKLGGLQVPRFLASDAPAAKWVVGVLTP